MNRTPGLLGLLATAFLAVATPHAEAASIRMLDPAEPGRIVELEATGLVPGALVSVALLPTLSRTERGVVITGSHAVPANGRIRVMFRWPRRYHVCPYRLRGGCAKRPWRRRQRVHVVVGGPEVAASSRVAARGATRIRLRRRGARAAALGPIARAAELPHGFNACGGWYIGGTKVSGSGYGAKVSIVPTLYGQVLSAVPPKWDDVWNELFNRCGVRVDGIDGEAQESLKQQLDCHILSGPAAWVGVESVKTWDLEAWRENRRLLDLASNGVFCNAPIRGALRNVYDSWLVHWSDDPKPHKTSWLVVSNEGDLVRRHIETAADFECLRGLGHPGPIALHADYMHEAGLDDQLGVSASCSQPQPPEPQPEPQPQPQPQPPPTKRITVDNRVTNGSTQMREDVPAYLSTVTRNYCKRDGCALSGTDVNNGAALTAECTILGDRTTNGQDNSSIDDGNPGLYTSTRWYGIRWGDGRFGYISEVWIASGHRGGLGLRSC